MSKLSNFAAFPVLAGLLALGLGETLQAQQAAGRENEPQFIAANSKKGSAKDSAGRPKGSDPAAVVEPVGGYRVGPDDELVISVWHEPELSGGVVVRSDGMITLPLVNDIKVSGLTTEETQSLLTDKLKGLVNDPQVTVIAKIIKSQKAYLVGNVAKQGAYALSGRQTVLELIAEAGGVGPFAKAGSIYILRSENGKQIRIPFNYKRALSGKGANPELLPGDMVVVP